MKKILELLTAAEAEAKRLADEQPHHAGRQILRARTRSALELAASPACAETIAPAPAPAPALKAQ